MNNKHLANRNLGIELLRIFSIIGVINLHFLGANKLQDNFLLYKIVYCLSFQAVNCFGLISGYVGYNNKNKNYNFKSLIKLYFTVVSYNLLFSIYRVVKNGGG